ncbi:flagellar protein FliT [Bacillus ectoiniformans]|uniref:flagellar protein FliT n=1 Tax=Bacillus ectoiniformans TaxID=1494429 RepID=UPI001955F6A7|nr:flagellar protein FliT [Bacillus ectoiniformans]MBM7649377.1 flagellar protein FliT [Bacillus ectoiniformans]
MTSVIKCYEVTRSLLQVLQKKSTERDQLLEEIDQLLEVRQALLVELTPPYTSEEKEMGKQIIKWNKEIDSILRSVHESIQSDIQMTSKKKTSVNKYTNPYASIQQDGMFYDKKN